MPVHNTDKYLNWIPHINQLRIKLISYHNNSLTSISTSLTLTLPESQQKTIKNLVQNNNSVNHNIQPASRDKNSQNNFTTKVTGLLY